MRRGTSGGLSAGAGLVMRVAALAVLALLALAGTSTIAVADTPQEPARASAEYQVTGVRTVLQRSAIAATGAAINGVEHGHLDITATAGEVKRIRAKGFTVVAESAPQATEPDIGTTGLPTGRLELPQLRRDGRRDRPGRRRPPRPDHEAGLRPVLPGSQPLRAQDLRQRLTR